MHHRPHIVLIIVRGEAVRNFLYSSVLRRLHEHARLTVLTVIEDEAFFAPARQYIDEIVQLKEYPERGWIVRFRALIHDAQFRWLWSKVAQNVWEFADARAHGTGARIKLGLKRAVLRALAFRPLLSSMTRLEQALSWFFRPTRELDDLFRRLAPDLVFNTSHIHGQAGELPAKVARRLGYRVAGFIFSWDNLTSRSRIFVPYDHYLVWHEPMKRQLLDLYPGIPEKTIHVTGTPQFDFHFDPQYILPRQELCALLGIDPARPFILWTTGVTFHFREEEKHIETVIGMLGKLGVKDVPQLVVRVYVKGLGEEMRAFSRRSFPDVVFPAAGWDERWATPRYDDLEMYTSLLHHAAVSINAASTVTLEFLMLDKPVINIGFDPPGSTLAHADRWSRHIDFDHFKPIAESGATMIARSVEDMHAMLQRSLENPAELHEKRQAYMGAVFGNLLDGLAGERVAAVLLDIVRSYADTGRG